MAPDYALPNDPDQPNDGWTFFGPADRAMDVHLRLLVDEATEALSRVKDIEKVRATMGRVATRG